VITSRLLLDLTWKRLLGPRKTRKDTKNKPLQQNSNSPNRLHREVAHLSDFVFIGLIAFEVKS
jgi:hypothetical protein